MNRLTVLLLFVLSLLSLSAYAQLDKEYLEQERLFKVKIDKCEKLYEAAQYKNDSFLFTSVRHYIDKYNRIFEVSEGMGCKFKFIGTLNIQNHQLIKIEEDSLVKYSKPGTKLIKRSVLGNRRVPVSTSFSNFSIIF